MFSLLYRGFGDWRFCSIPDGTAKLLTGEVPSCALVEFPTFPKDNWLLLLGGGEGDEDDKKLLDKLPKGVNNEELEEDIGDGGKTGLSLRTIFMLAETGFVWLCFSVIWTYVVWVFLLFISMTSVSFPLLRFVLLLGPSVLGTGEWPDDDCAWFESLCLLFWVFLWTLFSSLVELLDVLLCCTESVFLLLFFLLEG